jgi:sugar lactone lactonase YvrE
LNRQCIVTILGLTAITAVVPALVADTGLISTYAGGGSSPLGGPATSIAFYGPESLALDAAGNLFIADRGNYRIIRVDAGTGVATLVAGTGRSSFSGDGGPATLAGLGYPGPMVFDAAGNLYLSDLASNRVRRIDAQTGIITTFAGNGAAASSGDGGPATAASIFQPAGLAFDKSGSLLVADEGGSRLRRIDATTGIISTIAGNGTVGFSGDGGPALSASFNGLLWVTCDSNGNIYISDFRNDRIRRVDALTGIINTVVGNGLQTFAGDGLTATNTAIGFTGSVAFDSAGNLLFVSNTSNRLLRVDAVTNLVSTLAGTGYTLTTGDGGPATSASLSYPAGVVVAANGNAFVSEVNGNRVRRLALPSPYLYTNTALSVNTSQTGNITATVSSIGNMGTPTGSVQFFDPYPTVTATVPLTNGVASIPTNSLTPGNHTLSAGYSGDSTFNTSTSVANVFSSGPTQTTVTLSSPQNPVNPNSTILYGVAISPQTDSNGNKPSGPIDLLDGGAAIVSTYVSNGVVQMYASLSTPGPHSLTVFYHGDSNFSSSTSNVLIETVGPKATPTLTLSSSTNPSTAGGSVSFTASIAQTTATGTITFTDQASPSGTPVTLATVNLFNGIARFSTGTLVSGTHYIVANYSGDAAFSSASSSQVAQVVNQLASSVTIFSSQNPTTPNQGINITVQVAPSTATGTLQLLDGSTVVANATLANSAGILPVSFTTAGSHSLTVVYSGDATYSGSTSVVLSEAVKNLSTVTLTADVNPVTVGSTATLTATILQSTATGTVQFVDNPGSNGVLLGSVAVSNGKATFAFSSTVGGTHNIAAVYSGDTNFMNATSSLLSEVVRLATSTTVSAPSGSSVYAQPVTFTAAVAPAGATGTVQFLDGTTSLGTAALSSGSASLSTSALTGGTHSITAVYSGDPANAGSTSSVWTQTVTRAAATAVLASSQNPIPSTQALTLTATVSPNTATGTVQFLDGATLLSTATISNGIATFSPTLAFGSHPLTAVYSGDTNYSGVTSAAISQLVTTSTTTTLGANPATSSYGQAVQLSASIAPAPASGSIQFFDGSTSLGTVSVSAGTASFSISSLVPGAHSITAVYSGDGAAYLGSTSAAFAETVNKATTSVTASSSLNPASTGQAITFGASVTPAAATGSVQFFDGTTSLGTAPLSGGAASISISTLAAGSHSVTAVYSGDANYLGANSSALSQLVTTSTTTSLSASPATSSYGQAVQLSASIAPAPASGSVQFFDGSTSLGTVPVTAGAASLSISSLAPGAHSLTAVYSGDGAAYLGSTSAAFVETVNKIATTTAASSSLNPANAGQAVTFSATVSPSAATGTVQFFDGATSLGTASLSGGAASISISALAAGSHSITAVYSGDANDAASTSSAVVEIVKAISTISVQSGASSAPYGQAVQLTATVTPNTAAGSVQFLDGGVALGTSSISGGTASLSLSTLSVGIHAITAVYAGDANDTASSSAAWTQTISKDATTASLTSSLNPSVAGQSITLTSVVTPASATGMVQFLDGATVVGTGTISGGSASLSISTLAAGSHSMTAVYGGDANSAGATSGILAQLVKAVTSTTLQASSTTPSYGQAVQLTATVSPAAATGTVQFMDGSSSIGTATLSGGVAAVAVSTLKAGSHGITAIYSGDANDIASTSAVVTVAVSQAASAVTLASSLNPSVTGQSVTFTATVAPSGATGSVQFLDGSTSLGTVTLNAGSAALSVSSLSAGSHTITANYSGDVNFKAASAAKSQTVNVAPPSNLSATAASSSQINLTWTASSTSGVTYNVYSATTSGFTPSAANKIASGIGTTSYSNTGLTASTTHYYVVTAQNSVGESTASNQAAGTTQVAISCHVDYNVTAHTNTTFATAIKIHNSGNTPITGWNLSWTWSGNQQITQSSNSTYSQTGTVASLTNVGSNGSIAPGAVLSGVSFDGSYSGNNNSPNTFYVNGTLCH